VHLLRELYHNKSLIFNLAKNDFKTKYVGSYLGIIWAFIQPITTVLIYWFVFQYGLKSGSPIPDVPFVLWFVTGLVPWWFYQEALLNATNSLLEYSYLVKKVVFKISILPVVKIISSLFIHLVFAIFVLILFLGYGYSISIYMLQAIYYTMCTFILVLALSYITCSVVIFFKDLTQLIIILLQVGMWMTPIMWADTILPENMRWIFELNPMYYIVDGYRDCFINKIWFWEKGTESIYFWMVCTIIFGLGVIVFKKLKSHFADVL